MEQKKDGIDYGVYQIYGSHTVYGAGVLLYIGKAAQQTFGTRLSQEGWRNNQDAGRVEIYLGRLSGKETPDAEEWARQIDSVEKLLIYAHAPACNSSNINTIPDQNLRYVHVLNWGRFRDLLPEVSGDRWTLLHWDMEKYEPYGSLVPA